ncbi:MAG: SUMF1/EgtB/PvdO family nonheme iron enzyme [Bdellovibrio sp.]|nr:SUMF1/EgtB/PvdO family nonheme iron enzyme [Bdellovibrio sp.]
MKYLFALVSLLLSACSDVNPQVSLLSKGKLKPLVISGPDISIGNEQKEFTWTLNYDKNQTVVLTEDHISLVTSGDVTCATKKLTQDQDIRKVTVGGCQGNGDVRISVAAGSAVNLFKELMDEVNSAVAAKVDNTPPMIVLLKSVSLSSGNSQAVFEWTATYWGAEEIFLSLANVQLVPINGALVNCNVELLPSPLGDHVKILRASQCDGEGQYKITIQGETARDQAGNLILASTDTEEISIDNVRPTITVAGPALLQGNVSKVFEWTVTYSGHTAMVLSSSLITLTYSGSVSGCKKEVQNIDANSQRVRISECAGDGTVQVKIAEGAAKDSADNKTEEKNDLNVAVVDNTLPTLSVGTVTPTQGNSSTDFSWVVTYSNASAVDLQPSHITLSGTSVGGGGCTVTVANAVGVTQRTVKVTGCQGNGSLGISILPNSASDLAGNFASGASSASQATVDNSVFIGTLQTSALTVNSLSSIPVTLSFADTPQSGVLASQFTLQNATISSFTGSGTNYNFNLIPTSDGIVSIQLPAGVVMNSSNTPNVASNTLTFTVDRVAPSISIAAANVSIGNKTKTFSWPVTYAGANDITLTSTDVVLSGATTGCVASVSGTGSLSRTVSIQGCTGDGNLSFSLKHDTAKDDAGNFAGVSVSSSNVLVDNIPPSLAVTGPTPGTGSQSTSFVWTLHYSGSDSISLDNSRIILIGAGSTGCQKVITVTSATQRQLTISNCPGTGSLSFDVSEGSATDSAGNIASAKSANGSAYVDNSAPTLIVSAPSATLGNKTKSFEWTLTYSGHQTINLNNSYLDMHVISGAKTGCQFNISNGGNANEKKVAVSNCSDLSAELKLKVAANSAVNFGGVGTPQMTSSSSILIDNQAPAITSLNVDRYGGDVNTTFNLTVTYDSTALINLTPALVNVSYTDYSNSNVGVSCSNKSISGTGQTRVITVSGCPGDGEFSFDVQTGSAADAAGNQVPQFYKGTISISNTIPAITGIMVGEQKFGLKKPPIFSFSFNIYNQLVFEEQYKVVRTSDSFEIATSSDGYTFTGYNPTEGVQYKLQGRIKNSAGVWSAWYDSPSWTASFCPTNGYIKVPSAGGNPAFCIAKYEMRNSSFNAISGPAGTPWTGIRRGRDANEGAWKACTDVGQGFNLISNEQWQQVARNIEGTAINWIGGVGSGSINNGNVSSSPGVMASSEDNYVGTGVYKRTHTLSNGHVIWDFSGNAWEWTRSTNSVPSFSGILSVNYPSASTLVRTDYGPLGNYGVAHGMGLALSSGVYFSGPNYATMRGGDITDETTTGIYALKTNVSEYAQSPTVGFRCVFEPW